MKLAWALVLLSTLAALSAAEDSPFVKFRSDLYRFTPQGASSVVRASPNPIALVA